MSLSCSAESYRFGDQIIEFKLLSQSQGNFELSLNCKPQCGADKAIKSYLKHPQKLAPQDLLGGKNPASIYCSKWMKGVAVYGVDSEGASQVFCQFKDHSYLKFNVIRF
jgi:hypothetical protein